MESLSVIMPAYNEGLRIRDSIIRTHRQLKGMTNDFEIIVVNDGSSDDTKAVSEQVAREMDRVRIVTLTKNRGKGEALRQGFEHSSGDLIFFLDSDMDLPPEQMGVLLDVMQQDRADVVIGSKMHSSSRVDYPFYRRVVSFVYFTITKILFGLPVRDTQTGLKVFRREVLERCFPRLLYKAFALDLELLVVAHHLSYRIDEAPVIVRFQNKDGRYGYISFEIIKRTAIDTLAIFYRLNILHHYDEKEG